MTDEQIANLMPEAASRVIALITSGLQDENGVRVEDAIAVAATLAGSYLLKDTSIELSKLTPGSPVLVDEVNDLGPRMVTLMQNFASELGLDGAAGWDTEVPEQHAARLSAYERLVRFAHAASKIFEEMQFPTDTRAGMMALTTVRLIADGQHLLDENIAKGLALQALVEGSKIVPPSR